MKYVVSMMLILLAVLWAPQSVGALADIADEEVEIHRLMDQGIIGGYPDGYFHPNRDVTRAEAATMLVRALHLQGTADSFDDTDGHFAEASVRTATQAGLIGGHADGTFRPNDALSRGQMAAILNRGFTFDRDIVHFTDVDASNMFYDDIIALASSGVTQGYPDGTFQTNQSITRGEFSLMLARAMFEEYRPDTDSVNVDNAIGTGVVVNSPTLNVRPDPSTNNPAIGRLANGDAIHVHETTGNWALISSGETRGYVSQSYIMVDYQHHASPLYGQTIVIDPGHGGRDPGAVANGLQEKEIVLDVSLRLEEMLREGGANVIMTRRSDWYPSLSDRVAQANSANADVFVSVHTNAAGSTAARGTETFYSTTYWAGNSRKLAESLQSSMLEKLSTVDRGVKTANFQVIRQTEMPSALVELGFKTNAAEAERMKTDAFRQASADALYEGLVNYFD
ncbi:N-acetylmuramoyl-L-alanine amidase [Paenalkalicoccus suaedae]|uniref:N-acetylmuramoyl-L-alanine amidase n=1 Tax=Paenalkalicoccus suaedae TaxID=2592382 RepID=A0A859FA90_9BACI|nr:N-acetylmuramoyl-L-alanine amidase [Paenalkalicoccus suaedae]QKS70129.1 N-acetylmuramoyl-L-alanine amidase [Paenalkalicoccus suaedae]